MAGVGKKPPMLCSQAFARLFDEMSKAAVIDSLWCACQLGTDESAMQILTQAARNAVIAMERRKDRISPELANVARLKIDAD